MVISLINLFLHNYSRQNTLIIDAKENEANQEEEEKKQIHAHNVAANQKDIKANDGDNVNSPLNPEPQ